MATGMDAGESARTAFRRQPQPTATDTLASLITAASAAFDNDRDTAKACIARAVALLEGRSGRFRPQGAAPSARRGGLAPWQAKQVSAYIEAHLCTRIRATDLADAVQLSTSHFTRAFRETFGETPLAYVANKRMGYAQKLMLSSGECLSQIALACGHCDQSHFTRVFRRAVGMSPRAWRRQFATAPNRAAASQDQEA
jgi:AraC family transcriptional regulator